MLAELDQATAAFALTVNGRTVALTECESDEAAAVNLAAAYRRQHGVMPEVVPVHITVARRRPLGDDL